MGTEDHDIEFSFNVGLCRAHRHNRYLESEWLRGIEHFQKAEHPSVLLLQRVSYSH